jgi:glycosyltransferase involved in cell wall biosynthesis
LDKYERSYDMKELDLEVLAVELLLLDVAALALALALAAEADRDRDCVRRVSSSTFSWTACCSLFINVFDKYSCSVST